MVGGGGMSGLPNEVRFGPVKGPVADRLSPILSVVPNRDAIGVSVGSIVGVVGRDMELVVVVLILPPDRRD